MDKLLNVSRQGGFPITAEVLEALNGHTGYIEKLFGCFGLPARSAIVLSPLISFGNDDTVFMYIQSAVGTTGKIVKVTGANYLIKSDMMTSPDKYTLIDDSQVINIKKQQSDLEYPSCISIESYRIALKGNDLGWTFYSIYDIVGRGHIESQISSEKFTLPYGLSFSMVRFGYYKPTLQIGRRRIEIALALNHTATHNAYAEIVIDARTANIGFPSEFMYPLQALTGTFPTDVGLIPCYIYSDSNNYLHIRLNYTNAPDQANTYISGIITF